MYIWFKPLFQSFRCQAIYHHQYGVHLRTGEPSVGGVVLEHVYHVVQGDEGVVDGNNLSALGNSRAEDQATDTAESINTDLKIVNFLLL